MKKLCFVGMLCLFLGFSSAVISAQELIPLMPEKSEWSYTNDDPGRNWTTTWPLPRAKTGPAPFDTKDGNWPIEKRYIWLTREFVLPEDYKPGNLHVRYICDNIMWLHINGTLVYKANTQLDWGTMKSIQNLLRPGKNIIAVQCENEGTVGDPSNPGKIIVGLYTDNLPVPSKTTGGGEILASASFDNTIKTWDVKTGKLLKTFTGHTNGVQRVVFSPDGQRLYSASSDKTVRIWSVRTGQLLKTLAGHPGEVLALDVSADGKRLYSGCTGKVLKIWDAKTGNCLRTIDDEFRGGIESIQADKVGNHFAVAFAWEIDIRDANTGELKKRWTVFDYPGHRVAISPDGQHVLHTVQTGRNLRVYTTDGREIYLLNEKDIGGMNQCGFVPNSPYFLADSDKLQEILLINYHTKEITRRFKNSEMASIWTLGASADGSIFAAGTDKGAIFLWDVQTGRLLHTLKEHTRNIRGVAFSPPVSNADSESIAEAYAYMKIDKEKLAIETLEQAIAKEPKDYQTNCVLGMIYLTRVEKPEAAYTCHRQSIETGIKNECFLNNYGVAAMVTKRFSVAIESWERLAKIDKTLPELAQNVGLFMELVNLKKIQLKEAEHLRLADLYLDVCSRRKTYCDTNTGFLLLPPGWHDDCDKFFSRVIKRGKNPVYGRPYEVKSPYPLKRK